MKSGLWYWSNAKPWRLYLLLAVMIMTILWPLTTFQTTLKWDALDISLPWRYFVCDAVRNGILPLWNPFQFQGFAQGTEPQTWYLPALMLGLIKGYNLYSLNLEFVLHLIVAATGFYRLGLALGIKKEGLGWGALIFSLSGFFVGNAQHMGWIIAGAWIPHLLTSYHYFLKDREGRQLLYTALFSYLLVSGGYLAFSIVIAYTLIIWTVYHYLFKLPSNQKKHFSIDVLKLLALCGLTSGVVLVGIWDLSEHISRSTGLSGSDSMVGSLKFKHLLSWLFPFATIFENTSFWNGDKSIISVYMTLPGFILMLSTVKLFTRDKKVRLWWCLLIFALALSLGEELPFRGWINRLPLFDLFRFPSLFRYFVILLGSLLATRGLNHLMDHPQRQFILRLCLGVGVIFLLSLGYAFISGFDLPIDTLSDAFGIQSLLGLATLGLGGFLLAKVHPQQIMHVLVLLTFIELLIFVQFNGPSTIYCDADFETMQRSLQELPVGYPAPPLFDALQSNTDKSLQVGGLYRNTGMLYKRFTWDGYTPYQYHDFLRLEESQRYRKVLGEGALILSARKAKRPNADFHDSYPLSAEKATSLQIVDFDPNQISIETSTEHPRLLIYNQNYHPSWKAFVDDKPVQIHKSDVNLLSLHLPSGNHRAHFVFRPGSLINALWISGVTILLILIYLIASRNIYTKYILIAMLFYALAFWLTPKPTARSNDDLSKVYLVNAYDAETTSATTDRFFDAGDIDRLRQHISNASAKSMVAHRPNRHQDKITKLLAQHGDHIDSTSQDQWRLYQLRADEDNLCTFEGPAPHWTNALEDLHCEANGNHYQDCSERPYSASFKTRYTNPGLQAIEVSAKIKGETNKAQLVISAESPDGTRTWSTYRIRNILPNHKEWTKLEVVKSIPKQSLPIDIEVYLWNPQQEPIAIDDFEVFLKKG